MKASHTKQSFPFNNQDIEIKEGEFITGIYKACDELSITPQQYRTTIGYLKLTKRITTKSTNKFTLIKVNKWEEYQSDNNQNNKQSNKPITNQQQTNNKPITTYNKDKNEKNDKNNIYGNKFQKLSFINKGLMFNRINKYVKDFNEQPSQKQIDHWIDTELT